MASRLARRPARAWLGVEGSGGVAPGSGGDNGDRDSDGSGSPPDGASDSSTSPDQTHGVGPSDRGSAGTSAGSRYTVITGRQAMALHADSAPAHAAAAAACAVVSLSARPVTSPTATSRDAPPAMAAVAALPIAAPTTAKRSFSK